MLKVQQERPELLANTFLEPIKFLPVSPSCRELIDVWLQVSSVIPEEYLSFNLIHCSLKKTRDKLRKPVIKISRTLPGSV